MSEEAKLSAHSERIERVVAYIHNNLDAPLDMESARRSRLPLPPPLAPHLSGDYG
jgi:hypothetical protein